MLTSGRCLGNINLVNNHFDFVTDLIHKCDMPLSLL